MPNIEIHGFGEWTNGITRKVFEATKDLSFANEIVCTKGGSFCIDRKGENKSFLRIVSSSSDHIGSILECIKPLGCDIEVEVLLEFHPA